MSDKAKKMATHIYDLAKEFGIDPECFLISIDESYNFESPELRKEVWAYLNYLIIKEE